ncbi:LysR substrate-binding domain-containing protein [Defluviimonas aestuarii]|uniref:LysR substrate-binding domain-containing protein n=1 Tax=Albidovulum aestuarii TaxID=1130726 RepID=UPI00249AEC7F|nr:LysR substrate-binding domain-containing protein [Defluviimonas aestuarii]MDI3338766.1 LysR substrate-binding domain-containing protein [Defluviimonas aestuarii]
MAIPTRRLPLTALRTFEAAARRLSFKDAADELCVSATTVSNQIRQLERDWGVQLFVRKTRAVVLTDAGRSLAGVLARAFSEIRDEIDAHIQTPTKSVALAVGPIFGARWLIPRLGRFRAQNPKIELVLQHAPRITGIESMPSQVAIDWGVGDWPGVEARSLFRITYAPIAAPTLIERFGGLNDPADLARYPVIHQQDRGEWQVWLKLAGVPGLKFLEETIVTDSNVVAQAALEGQGVALGIFPFMQSDIDAGRLARPFETDLHPERAYHLLTRPNARQTPEIRAVCDWIVAEAAAMQSG